MTTFNELGTQFADLEDRVKDSVGLSDFSKVYVNETFNSLAQQSDTFFDALERMIAKHRADYKQQFMEAREHLIKQITAQSNELTATLGYDTESAAEPAQQEAAE
jgi:hypothetical protein